MQERVMFTILAIAGAFVFGIWYGKSLGAEPYKRHVRLLPYPCQVAWDEAGRDLNEADEGAVAQRP